MVSDGVSKLDCTELVFVDPGTKINGAYYRDVLLRHKLLPAILRVSGNNFIFQQDSAHAHRACKLCSFRVEKHRTSNSPDLNLHCEAKNCTVLFLPQLFQIETFFDNFWQTCSWINLLSQVYFIFFVNHTKGYQLKIYLCSLFSRRTGNGRRLINHCFQ